MITKSELRKIAKDIRSKLDMTNLSKRLAANLKLINEYKNAENVMIFYPLEDEVNLLELLNDKSKKFFLPKIDGKNLLCCPFNEGDETCLSCFKTCEPLTEPCEKNLIDLVIIPALAVDRNHNRLGYGGGFYDRFLMNFKGKKIVCIPSSLVFDSIHSEKHDIVIDRIITEKDDF